MKIDRKSTIGEIVQMNPETARVFFERGLHCLGCSISFSETLEDGARAHGIDDRTIDKMVDEINKILATTEDKRKKVETKDRKKRVLKKKK